MDMSKKGGVEADNREAVLYTTTPGMPAALLFDSCLTMVCFYACNKSL